MGVFINPPNQQSIMSQVNLHKWTLIFDKFLRWGVDDEDANLDHGALSANQWKEGSAVHPWSHPRPSSQPIHVPKEGLE